MKSKRRPLRLWLVWLTLAGLGLSACGPTATPTTSPEAAGATIPTATPAATIPVTPTATAPTAIPTRTRPPYLSHNLETVWRTGDNQDRLRYLTGLATDSVGNLYLSDGWRQIVRKYDSTGQLLFEFSTQQYNYDFAQALATDNKDNFYLLSNGGEKLSKYDPAGHLLLSFRPDNNFEPAGGHTGLAVDENGQMYVLDSVGRVYVYDNKGTLIKAWGNPVGRSNPEQNKGPGQLNDPHGLVADRHGHIYIGNSGNHRIEKFTLDGRFVAGWGVEGKGHGQFGDYLTESGLGVDGAGNVYVADPYNYRVQKFDATGNFLTSWGSGPGNGDGQFIRGISAVAVDPQGAVYITDLGNERVQKFDQAGHLLAKIGRQNQGEGVLTNPVSIATDGVSSLYVADSTTRTIQKYDKTGHFLLQWLVPTFGSVKPNIDDRLDLALDHAGQIYVADAADSYIKKYDSTGHLLLSWGGRGQDEGQFNAPGSPFVDELNNIYFVDSGNFRLQKFDDQGHFLFKLDFHSETNARGETVTMSPIAVALDRQNHIYVAFPNCNCIRKYDGGGRLLLTWGQSAPNVITSNDGDLLALRSLALDSAGNLYVMDLGNLHCTYCRVQKFDQQGHLLAAWHSQFNASPMFPPLVIGNGQFATISAMTVDQEGNLYVGESGYGRVQKLHQTN